jgi:PAS domain S-box-containing protein
MKISIPSTSFGFRIAVSIASLLLLIFYTIYSPPVLWLPVLITAGFISFIYNFPIRLFRSDTNAIHIVTITSALTVGAVTTAWAVLIGIFLGVFIQRMSLPSFYRRIAPAAPYRFESGLVMGMQFLPLMTAFALTGWEQWRTEDGGPVYPYAVLAMLLFIFLHAAIYILDIVFSRKVSNIFEKEDIADFAVLELLPLPFILMTLAVSENSIWMPLLIISGITAILSVLINRFNQTRSDLERRLQDLSTLNNISRVLRSTLNLENLLSVIHVQVTQLLKIDNFYVALYDAEEEQLWYPLAVKHGQRQAWQPRQMKQDRLTDRVIKDGKPILLNPNSGDDPSLAGLPASEETPAAWIGVPLITSDSPAGCLAVFSVKPSTVFNQGDLNLLIILSGQVSVAIENALLYEQAQRRAEQLETLNRISTLITASLDQKEVLSQVCRSVTEVGGAQFSAIFLLNSEQTQVSLAHSYRLSKRFQFYNESFSVNERERTRCLRSAQPVLTPTFVVSPLKVDYLKSISDEGIEAFAELPLSTPDGQIGFLAVYYSSPHNFTSEEVDLLQTFASQAALAVSNARLYSHVDTALTRRAHQLSILEAVGRELAAAIGSERLFDMILDYATQFTLSRWGELSLYHGSSGVLKVKASRGYLKNRTSFLVKEDTAGRVVLTLEPLNLGNVTEEPRYNDLTDGEARSLLAVPLIHEGRMLGLLKLESQRSYAYDENDQSFINQLATQAAVAVVNAGLYRETQRRLLEQSILYEVGKELIENLDLESVLQTLTRSIADVLQSPSIGIYLWEEKQSNYVLKFSQISTAQSDCQLPPVISFPPSREVHPTQLKTGPLRITNKRDNELLGTCQNCRALVFPIIANKQPLGITVIQINKKLPVEQNQLDLLQAIVSQVSIALQNALLFSDITHHRDRMAALLNSVEEGILMMDSDGNIMLANEMIRNIMGLDAGDLINHPFAGLSALALNAIGYTRQKAEKLVQDLGQSTGAAKNTWKTKDSISERVLERFTSPVWAQGGRIIGWMLVLRDVTEEHRLIEARELITSTLIHDLRSPVSAVISAVDIIEDVLSDKTQDEIVSQALRVAYNGANRVLGLIESLLDIARMQSGIMELNLLPVNFHKLTANCLNEFVPQASEYSLFMFNEVPQDLPALIMDPNKITRVMTNLLDNAVKFTPTGGKIHVDAQVCDGNTLMVRLRDSGPGIPEIYHQKIFDRFTQIPGQPGRRRGSGLGLTFCRMAVEAHGGKIWVESAPPPETGSIFSFTLPLAGEGIVGSRGMFIPDINKPGYETED